MTDKEFSRWVDNVMNKYECWKAVYEIKNPIEKQTIDDLMRESFFAGYEEGERNE